MNFKQSWQRRLVSGASCAALTLAALVCSPSARANVYATNIKLNGSLTNAVGAVGDSATISYILNESATRGITIDILSGTNRIRRLQFPGGNLGTFSGLNSVMWDGRDANSNTVAPGSYSVSIAAASSGYTNWTPITADTDSGPNATYVFEGRGIAVDRNPGSPYYGRVFVANAIEGPSPASRPGDNLGILKFNADASGADEGIPSTGLDGYTWLGNHDSPWKLEVSADDFVYVDDLELGGDVYRWDPTFSADSLTYVLRADNRKSGARLSGPALTGSGTNTQIWMANLMTNLGLLRWTVSSNGVCASNDVGVVVAGFGSDPNLNPTDIALDKSGNLYTCVAVSTSSNATQRVFRFPAYDPSTNGGAVEVTPDWAVGSGNDAYGQASGLAVDPTGTYVAVAFSGVFVGGLDHGNTAILYATNGALVTSLDLDLAFDGQDYTEHDDTDCAWDAVGNVYYIDNWYGFWRAFSPPGTNQATTLAATTLLLTNPIPPAPVITSVSVSGGMVTIDFTAGTRDAAEDFAVLGASQVTGPYSIMGAAVITQLAPGSFEATLPADGLNQYFRIGRRSGLPTEGPAISKLTVSGANVTVDFTGSTSDGASAFTLLSASTPTGPYGMAAGSAVAMVSPGVFRATAPVNGPMQFYRIQR